MTPLLKSSALAVALTLGASGAALAAPFTSGSGIISASTSTTTDLASTTAFALSPASFTFTGSTGDFSGLTVTQADAAFNLGTISSFNFTSATVGTFTATGLLAAPVFNAAAHSLSFVVLGNFAPGSDFTGPASLTADEAFSLNQIGGAGTGIGITATFFSPQVLPPPPPSSPEPMTISLFGAGLAALGVVRRRRK
jgi:hypothetical protein